jgi:hypothetical protein
MHYAWEGVCLSVCLSVSLCPREILCYAFFRLEATLGP